MPESIEKVTPPEVSQPAPVDGFLQMWVAMANKGMMSFDLTLQVKGILVSGVLIGHKEYLKNFGSKFAQAMPGIDNTERARWAKMFAPEDSDTKESGNEEPSFIHLRDTKFIHNSGAEM